VTERNSEVKTPDEWQDELGLIVLDPDGWRRDGTSWTKPITREEFETKLASSTIDISRSSLEKLIREGK